MSTLAVILLVTAAGSVLSLALAALLAFSARPSWVPVLVSYAIGALLGASLLEVLPEAVHLGGDIEVVAQALLGGILLFFLLEKLVLWRHCHEEVCEAHGGAAHAHDHGRSGLMITVGDTVHNFVDGVMIAAAFLVDFKLGVVTAFAIAAHEVPQELGDFLILLHSGYTKRQALLLNLLSSLAMMVGAVLGYFLLAPLQWILPYMLAIAASGMIYVAVADLIPGLHKRVELAHTGQQALLIGLGILTVWAAGSMAHEWMHAH